jgi:hypothetical protein
MTDTDFHFDTEPDASELAIRDLAKQLFEARGNNICHAVRTLLAAETEHRRSVVAARGLSDAEAENRMSAAYGAKFAVIVHYGADRLSRALEIAAEHDTEI